MGSAARYSRRRWAISSPSADALPRVPRWGMHLARLHASIYIPIYLFLQMPQSIEKHLSLSLFLSPTLLNLHDRLNPSLFYLIFLFLCPLFWIACNFHGC